MATDVSAHDDHELDEVDNPIERLKLLGEDDEAIARYLDSIEITSPREREMLYEISRTRTLARPELFPQAHRNMVEALESLARHGYHGTTAGGALGPLAFLPRFAVKLVARYVVVSHVRTVSTQLRNLYGLREIQSPPGSSERQELNLARLDAERMVDALKSREIGLPTFVIGAALVPIFAALGRVTGLLESARWATVLSIAGMILAIVLSWVLLRGAALASRRIRLATRGPAETLWATIGWCGRPPRDQSRTFMLVSVGLTVSAWIIVPALIAIAVAT
jgi:hypothetical protein